MSGSSGWPPEGAGSSSWTPSGPYPPNPAQPGPYPPNPAQPGPYPPNWQAAPPPPPPPSPPRSRSRGPLIAGVALVLILALAAGVALAWPTLGRLLPFGPKEPAGPAASYLNGATQEWVLDLTTVLPTAKNPRFSFGPNMDDAGSNLRYGPVDGGDVLLADTWTDTADGPLLGIDAATGAVLWQLPGYRWMTCAAGPGPGVFACLGFSESARRLFVLDARTGEQRLAQDVNADYLLVDGDSILLAGSDGTVTALDPAGRTRWSTPLPKGNEPIDIVIPVRITDGLVAVIGYEASTILDVRTGEILARGDYLEPIPGRRAIARRDAKLIGTPTIEILRGYHATPMDAAGRWGLFRETATGLEWCDPKAPASCRPLATHLAPTGLGEGLVSAETTAYARLETDGGSLLVDVADGRISADLTTAHEAGWITQGGIAPGPILVQARNGNREMHILDPATGRDVASATLDHWYPVLTPTRRLLLAYAAPEPGTPVANFATRLASFAPATSPQGLVVPAATPAGQQPTRPAGLPECPAGSIQLAYAVFPDGWVLVCGVQGGRPTSWHAKLGGQETSSTTIAATPDGLGYLATLADGSTAWITSRPATVGTADAAGVRTSSRSGGQIVFVVLPQANPGTLQQVPPPQATAEDQVRYLDALLARSAESRRALEPAVVAVRECSHGAAAGGYGAEVATIEAVTANRVELIAALRAAPVDLVPDGLSLVSELTQALDASRQADVAFGSWAQQVNGSGCPSGSDAEGRAWSDRAGAKKTTFMNHWNSVIVPRFGVAQQTREKL